jgi:poly-gamma-glutamate capsule biosynthesis protein CapA/YwtB (metallophosphatase superfamily)
MKYRKRILPIFPLIIITVLGLGSGALLAARYFAEPRSSQATKATPLATGRPATPLTVYLPPEIKNEYASTIETFARERALSVIFTDTADTAALRIVHGSGASLPPSATAIQRAVPGQPVPLTDSTLIKPPDTSRLFLVPGQGEVWNGSTTFLLTELIPPLAERLNARSPAETWTLTALGDVILGRWVLKRMQDAGSYTVPFAATAQETSKADLTIANLEVALTDRADHPLEGMSFRVPEAAAAGLTFAGIDAVNLANNHSYNGGSSGFADTLAALHAHKVKAFGGGTNRQAAHAPLILEVKGTKVALLGYSSIVGTVAAGIDRNGMATFSAAPWGDLDEQALSVMEADIRAAGEQADVVLVYTHWGSEYTHEANADQRTVAHRLIDAGADLILGTHPHWVQGVEWYKERLITYSLGNFVFDQEWSLKTKQGTYLNATFSGSHLIQAELIPYQIEDFHQPRFVAAAHGKGILQDVYDHSFWPVRP